MADEALIQCDCCDYFTISEGQSYEICPVCFWEQDFCGITEPNEPSGPNHGLTLFQGRKNFGEFGACEKRFISEVITDTERKKYHHAARNLKF